MHTVLVGNGILALTTAFRLAKRLGPTDQVTIIGRSSRPGSATLAAAAMLNSFAEIDAGGLESEAEFYRFELSHLATRMWPKFILDIIQVAGSRLPPGCAKCEGPCGGCFDRGTYVVNNTAADDLDDENFDAIVAALEKFDEPYEHVSPRDIPNYQPAQPTRATRAILLPNEGWLNPRLTIDALEAALSVWPQVRIVDSSVERLVQENGLIQSVLLDNGMRIEGDKFVLANGACAGDLLRQSGLDLAMQRLFYGVGISLEIKSIDHPHKKCIRTPNRGLACGIYSVPFFVSHDQPHNHLVIGASNHIMDKPSALPRLASVESLSRAAMEQINAGFYCAELVRVNVGWRPTSQDTFPLVGPTSIPNLIIATGTKRDGFHLSPLLSGYLAAMVHGEDVDPRFAVFAPERKLLHELTREQAISKAVRHQISAAYQHGFSPSKSRMPQQLAELYRTELERLHDHVGAHDWGIPPEMIEPYRAGHAVADGSYPAASAGRRLPLAR